VYEKLKAAYKTRDEYETTTHRSLSIRRRARKHISFISRLHYFTRLIINTCSHPANIFHIFTRHPVYTPHPFPSFAIPRHSRHVLRIRDGGVRAGKRRALWKIVRSISFRFVLPPLLAIPPRTRFIFPAQRLEIISGGSRYSAGILIKFASFNYSAIDSRAI